MEQLPPSVLVFRRGEESSFRFPYFLPLNGKCELSGEALFPGGLDVWRGGGPLGSHGEKVREFFGEAFDSEFGEVVAFLGIAPFPTPVKREGCRLAVPSRDGNRRWGDPIRRSAQSGRHVGLAPCGEVVRS